MNMHVFLSLDTQLFLFINHLPHVAFTDWIFIFLSGIGDTGFVWFILGIWLILREEKRDHPFLFPLGIAGFMSWFLSEVVIKNFVVRLRPSFVLADAIVRGGLPNGYSFPSSHATLAFALATVLIAKEPRWRGRLYTLAFLIAFSRIYLGDHYPSDVIAGSILGYLIGRFVLYGYHVYLASRGKRVVHRPRIHRKHKHAVRKQKRVRGV